MPVGQHVTILTEAAVTPKGVVAAVFTASILVVTFIYVCRKHIGHMTQMANHE